MSALAWVTGPACSVTSPAQFTTKKVPCWEGSFWIPKTNRSKSKNKKKTDLTVRFFFGTPTKSSNKMGGNSSEKVGWGLLGWLRLRRASSAFQGLDITNISLNKRFDSTLWYWIQGWRYISLYIIAIILFNMNDGWLSWKKCPLIASYDALFMIDFSGWDPGVELLGVWDVNLTDPSSFICLTGRFNGWLEKKLELCQKVQPQRTWLHHSTSGSKGLNKPAGPGSGKLHAMVLGSLVPTLRGCIGWQVIFVPSGRFKLARYWYCTREPTTFKGRICLVSNPRPPRCFSLWPSLTWPAYSELKVKSQFLFEKPVAFLDWS